MTRGVSALRLEQFAHQAPGSLCIPAALHQHVDDETLLINGPPEPALPARNADDDFVHVPFVAEAAGGSAPDLIGKMPSKFFRPVPDRLVSDDDAAGRQHVLDHAQAEWEAEVEPHRLRNDLSGKAVAAVQRITSNLRHAAQSQISVSLQLTLRCRHRCDTLARAPVMGKGCAARTQAGAAIKHRKPGHAA